MKYAINKLDIKTDLRRSAMASFSPKAFGEVNVQTFLSKAEENLEVLKDKISKNAYREVKIRIKKAKDSKNPIEKRREDLLTASYLL